MLAEAAGADHHACRWRGQIQADLFLVGAVSSTDELDPTVGDLARDVEAGLVDEDTARMMMFEAVFRSGLIKSATTDWCGKNNLDAYLLDDMVDQAEGFCRDKILEVGSDFFSIKVLAQGASASGAIRQMLRSNLLMANTFLRKVRRVHRPEFIHLDAQRFHDSSLDSTVAIVELVAAETDNASAALNPRQEPTCVATSCSPTTSTMSPASEVPPDHRSTLPRSAACTPSPSWRGH